MTLDSSQYEAGLASSESKAQGVGDSIAGIAKRIAQAQIVKEVVDFATEAVNAGRQFDAAMSQVAATMGTTTDSIMQLRDFAREMGATTAFSAQEAAEALNFMALAGYDADQAMKMLPTVLNLAAAGGIALASASDMVTDAQSALGLSFEQTTALVDQMAVTASKSNTSVAQLGEAILTIGGTAKDIAGGTTELTAALGILADNGIKGAEGGTALRNVLLALEAPTDKAAATMAELGLQVFNAEGNLRPLPEIFGDLNSQLSNLSAGERTAVLNEIFNKVDLKSVNALLGTNVERWEDLIAAIDAAQGAAEKMAETQLDNLEGDITKFNSAMGEAKIAISDVLTPAIREFVQAGTEGVSRLTTAFKEGGLSGVMQELGTMLSELGGTIATKMHDAMVEVSQTNWAEVGQRILAGITSAFTNITGWATGIFTLARNAIVSVDWAQAGTDAFNLLKGAFTGISDWFTATFLPGPDGIIAVDWVGAGTAILGAIGQGLGGIIDAFKGFFKPAISAITSTDLNWASAGTRIMGLIGGAFGAVGEWFTALFGPAVTAITGTELNWASAGSGIMTAVTGGVGDPAAWATELFTTAKNAVIEIPWAEIGTAIDTAITGAGSALAHIAGEMTGFFNDAATSIKEVDWASVGATAWSTIREAFSGVRDWFGARFETVRTAILNIEWNELGSSVMNLITTAFTGVGDTLKGFFDSAWADIQAIDWPSLGSNIRLNIMTGLSNFIEQAKLVFDGAKANIASIDWKAAGDDLRQKIETGIEAIKGFVSGLFGQEKDDALALDWKGFGESITELVQEGLKGLDGFLEGLLGEEQWNNIKTTVENTWNGITETIQGAIKAVEDFLGITAQREKERLEQEAKDRKEAAKAQAADYQTLAENFADFSVKTGENLIDLTNNARDNYIKVAEFFGKPLEGSALFDDYASETIEFLIEDLEHLWYYNESQLETSSAHSDNTSAIVQNVMMYLDELLEYMGTDVKTLSDHVDDTSPEVIKAIASLKQISEWANYGTYTYSEHRDEVSSIVQTIIGNLSELMGYQGLISQTSSVHDDITNVITNYVTASEGSTTGKMTEYSSDGTIVKAGAPAKKGGFQEVALNARSMFGGTILKGATFFGWDEQGRPQIGGGEGPEAVVGVGSLTEQIREAVREGFSGALSGISGALNGEDRPIYVVLDTGALVGAMGAKMDSELGKIGDWKGGGRA